MPRTPLRRGTELAAGYQNQEFSTAVRARDKRESCTRGGKAVRLDGTDIQQKAKTKMCFPPSRNGNNAPGKPLPLSRNP